MIEVGNSDSASDINKNKGTSTTTAKSHHICLQLMLKHWRAVVIVVVFVIVAVFVSVLSSMKYTYLFYFVFIFHFLSAHPTPLTLHLSSSQQEQWFPNVSTIGCWRWKGASMLHVDTYAASVVSQAHLLFLTSKLSLDGLPLCRYLVVEMSRCIHSLTLISLCERMSMIKVLTSHYSSLGWVVVYYVITLKKNNE